MGRGLSELQEAILSLAYSNRLKFGTVPGYADIYPWEFLTRYYRWLPFPRGKYQSPSDVRLPEGTAAALRWRRNNAAAAVFSKQQIGEKKFNSVMASLYRAMSRLESRELMLPCGAGRSLTELGCAIASTLADGCAILTE